MNFLNNPLWRAIRYQWLIVMSSRNQLRGPKVYQIVQVRIITLLPIPLIGAWFFWRINNTWLDYVAAAVPLFWGFLWIAGRVITKTSYWWDTRLPRQEKPEFTKFDKNLATTPAPLPPPIRGNRMGRLRASPKQ